MKEIEKPVVVYKNRRWKIDPKDDITPLEVFQIALAMMIAYRGGNWQDFVPDEAMRHFVEVL